MPPITPCLWFDGDAEAAVAHYTALFPGSSITKVTRVQEGGLGEPGSVLTITFELLGQPFMALNGGPHYHFTPAVSFSVPCESQAELDRYWDALAEGGQEMPCGWVTDRFGLSWQIVPADIEALMNDPDPVRHQRVWGALMGMRRVDIAALKAACAGAA
ncbi:MAG: VOC family protein [Alphaproteobacteria bacterium]|nr:VOC family protein [Alphaproteobacteria bacterium]